ncbi:MAG: carbohydrate ABC transporter permease [Candidatus Thermoplasmatota archaeon]|nr:carbohydrate ABC transporter permease [Candidatus Thermoplasmatota archaeon]
MQSKNKIGMILLYIAAIILAVVFFFPIWILILTAFQPSNLSVYAKYPSLILQSITLTNVISSFKTPSNGLVGSLLRSLEVAFIVGFLALGLGIPASYGLSKISASISNKIIVLLFLVNMMPGLVIAIPIASDFIRLGIQNTSPYVVFSVAFAQELVVLPLTVFVILGGFRSLPKDLENQARVDGANFRTAFSRLLLPLNKIAILVAFLLAWMTSWDEFTYAVIVAPIAPFNTTFPVTLQNYVSYGHPLTSATFALVASIPVIILAVFLMKYLKGGYLSGGLIG